MPIVTTNPWRKLIKFTDARIALGRVGISIPTKHHLEFQLAHAKSRKAVHYKFDKKKIETELAGRNIKYICLNSAAENRAIYLQRIDLGRKLDEASITKLKESSKSGSCDILLVIVDGLSALAIESSAIKFIDALLPQLSSRKWQVAPVVVVEQGRVAIGDRIAQEFKAKVVIVLIGERPGLSAPNSMGVYLTWDANENSSDANRNCISNIRSGGLDINAAVNKLMYLLDQAFYLKLSGVQLKDESVVALKSTTQPSPNFLLE